MTITLRTALEAARALTEKGEPNPEYIRGQQNLISDLFGLGGDFGDDTAEIVVAVIAHEMSVDEGVWKIAALIGGEPR